MLKGKLIYAVVITQGPNGQHEVLQSDYVKRETKVTGFDSVITSSAHTLKRSTGRFT